MSDRKVGSPTEQWCKGSSSTPKANWHARHQLMWSLHDRIIDGRDATTFRITVLGFSQGAATACRWLNAGHIRINQLILWAGYFPNGLTDLIDPTKLTDITCQYVYGRQDEFLVKLSDPEAYLQRLKTDVPNLTLTAFDGGHRVESAVLRELLSEKSI